jgi:DNA-binding NarL/FixJ family response regulator
MTKIQTAPAKKPKVEKKTAPMTSDVSPPKRAKVLIVDDHPAVREGLALRIEGQPDLEVCGQASDVPEALRAVPATCPDVAVVDISLKAGNGLDLIKRLKTHPHPVRILVWSMHGENLYAERALRAGAQGYITKEEATEQIIEAIRQVRDGKVYLSDKMKEQLLKRAVTNGGSPARSPVEDLSDRELEVFQMIGQGLETQSIAKKMFLSPKTVETYISRIKKKLDLATSRELLQRAAQWEMTKA